MIKSRTTIAAIRIKAVSESPDSLLAAAGAAVVLVDEEVVVAADVVVRATVVDVEVDGEVEELVEDEVVDDDDVGWATAIPTESDRSAAKIPPTRIGAAPLLAPIPSRECHV
jgi:hypothetical protein